MISILCLYCAEDKSTKVKYCRAVCMSNCVNVWKKRWCECVLKLQTVHLQIWTTRGTVGDCSIQSAIRGRGNTDGEEDVVEQLQLKDSGSDFYRRQHRVWEINDKKKCSNSLCLLC